MFDVALYGHMTYDRIFNDFKETTAVGAIGNVWSALLDNDKSVKIHIAPSEIGEGLIYQDRSQSKRASTANMSIKKQYPDIQPAKWNHICYLNTLQDVSFIDDLKGIVSADICVGKKLNLDLLSKIDYLFISDEDLNFSIDTYFKHGLKKWLINHYPSGSVTTDGKDNTATYSNKPLNNVNVLGLGDRFAAYVISNIIVKGMSCQEAVIHSHLEIKEWLKKSI